MSQQVLYRRYRPQSFKEVVGQEHITNSIKEQIKTDNLSHAYLFSGGRGTGKTSLARIIASQLGATDKDIYEIDAASNTGVDDVRELREGVRSLPFESTKKVYIIDEVHMLSKAAFNALLKTLEEPPAHVVFILATTEIHKVPETVISRCQFHTFKKPGISILMDVVKKVAKKEGYKIDNDSARLIASLGEGSYRDTLGVLQTVISSLETQDITLSEVEKITGGINKNIVFDFLENLINLNCDKCLEIIDNVIKQGVDIKTFTKQVLEHLRLVMVLKYSKDMRSEIKDKVGEDFYEKLDVLSNHENSNKLSGFLKELLNAHEYGVSGFLPQLPLEIAVVTICDKLKNN